MINKLLKLSILVLIASILIYYYNNFYKNVSFLCKFSDLVEVPLILAGFAIDGTS
jgi:hypothetical protein